MTTAEDVYYDEAPRRVTSSVISIEGSHYPVRSVSSFRQTADRPSGFFGWVLLVPSALSWIGLLIGTAIYSQDPQGTVSWGGVAVGVAVLSLIVAVSGAAVRRSRITTHRLYLRAAGGEFAALASRDGGEVTSVVRAVAQAVSARRL